MIEGVECIMNEVFNKLTNEDQDAIMKLVDYANKFHEGMQRVLLTDDPNEINKIIESLQVVRPKGRWTKESHEPSDLNVLIKRLTTGSGTLEIKLCEYCDQPFFAYTTASKVYCERNVTDNKPCRIIGPTKQKLINSEFSRLNDMMNESLEFYQKLLQSGDLDRGEYGEYKETLQSKLKAYKICPSSQLKEEFMRVLLKG